MTDRQQRIVYKFKNQTSYTQKLFKSTTDQEILEYLGHVKKLMNFDFDKWMRGKNGK